MTLTVLQQVASSIQAALFVINNMVDETSDISNKKQVVICFRWVNDRLEAHEDVVRFVQGGVHPSK